MASVQATPEGFGIAREQPLSQAGSSATPSSTVVFQFISGQSYQSQIQLQSGPQRSTSIDKAAVMAAIQSQIQHFSQHEAFLSRIFGKYQLGLAKVEYALPTDHDASCGCYRTCLSNFSYQGLLTETYHDLCKGHPAFSVPTQSPASHTANISSPHRPEPLYAQLEAFWQSTLPRLTGTDPDRRSALAVRRILDRNKVARLCALLAAFSPILIIIVTACTRKFEAAIALGTALLALLACIQFSASWYLQHTHSECIVCQHFMLSTLQGTMRS